MRDLDPQLIVVLRWNVLSRIEVGRLGRPASGATMALSRDRLNHIVDERAVDVVDLMETAAQGAEGIVLQGLEALLLDSRVERLLLERHSGYLAESGCSTGTIRRQLEGTAYLAWSIDHSPSAIRRAAYGAQHNLAPLAAITSASSDSLTYELRVSLRVPVPEEPVQ